LDMHARECALEHARQPQDEVACVGALRIVKRIPLTRGLFAIVDDDDYERLARFRWRALRAVNTWYATRGAGKYQVLMHREVLKTAAADIDHRDRNGLNNRRRNLRAAEHFENCHNRPGLGNVSGFKGVFPNRNGWMARIMVRKRLIYLGTFNTPAEAAHVYNNAAKRLVGEFAWRNKGAARRITARVRKVPIRKAVRSASGLKGVQRHRRKFRVRLCVNGGIERIGSFDTVVEAIIAYNAAAVKRFGLAAVLNPLP
jgi:hypothetical protein